LDAARLSRGGAANIAVFTPAPGGGTSATIALTIGPARWGDVNGNGTTDMTDMLSALRIALGVNAASGIATGDVAPEYPASAGGYGDGRITILDAVRILGFLRNP
jgi:hypothetical protein